MPTEIVLNRLCFGEGPRWHDGALWFSDMHDHKVLLCALVCLAQSLCVSVLATESDTPNAVTRANPAVSALRELTLISAIRLSLSNNHGLLAGEQALKAGKSQVKSARAQLLPRLSAEIATRRIDADRAEAGIGRLPENLSHATLSLTQTLFSEDKRARYQVENILQAARQQEQLSRVLNTVLDTSTAFLNLLRQEALTNIQRQNLKLIESNYQRAESRLQLGVANRSEIYRWETQKAGAQRDLSNSISQVLAARIELNRIMNRPLGDQYRAAHPGLKTPELLVSSEDIRQAFGNPAIRPLLREYYVDAALTGNPELEQLSRQKDVQARHLTAARHNLYLPRIEAKAGYTQELGRGGAGKEKLDIDFGQIFPGRATGQIGGLTDKTEWQVGITARLPLYLGGQQYSERARQQAEFSRAENSYDQARIDLRAAVMAQLLATQASFDNISFASTAARASQNNLDLVTEAYTHGVVPIIDLLDAQVAALKAKESRTNSVYDFLIDYLRLQRFTGRFDVTATQAEREQMKQNLIHLIKP